MSLGLKELFYERAHALTGKQGVENDKHPQQDTLSR